jgi:hypothetical protein
VGAAAVVLTVLLQQTCPAQPPASLSTSPQAIAPGQTASLVVKGQRLNGASGLWTTFSAPAPLTPDVANNGQNEAECAFQVAVPADIVPGIHAVRVLSPQGASPLTALLIDDLPTVTENAANQTLETAQEIPAQCGIDGRIDNLSRDFYKFAVKAGQTVSLEVFARRLGSPLDASLYLYDEKGKILTYCDDAEGLSSDPQLVHAFKKAGVYVVEVRDIRYQGGGQHIYRLRIGDFPCVNTATPLAVQRGTQSRVDFAGISVADASPAYVSIPADWPHPWYPVSTKRAGGASSGFATVTVVDTPDAVDHEPNNTQPQAIKVPLGTSISGRFDQPGDVDRYTFAVAQGQRFLFTGITREHGSPADLLLRVLDASGNQVAAADDNGTAEGVVDFTFPAAGDFTLEVADLNRRGGPQYVYRIAAKPWEPGFTLSVSADTVSVPAGGVAALTVTTARKDFGGPIELSVEGLPAGYSVPPTHLGPGMNQVVLTIQSEAGAPATSLTGISVVGRATIGSTAFETRAQVDDELRARWNAPTYVPARLAREFALAAAPASKLTLKVDPPVVVFGKHLKATAKVVAQRGEGLDEAIALAINPAQNGLPPNVAVDVKPIEKGQQEAVLTFTANENAALGPFTIALNGTHQKDNVATVVSTPGIGLRLEPPFAVSAAVMEQPVLAKGGQLKLKISLQRNPAFTGDVKLACEKLPTGVTAGEVTFAAGQTEGEVVLSAAADAPAASVSDVSLRGICPADGKLTAVTTVPAFSVR